MELGEYEPFGSGKLNISGKENEDWADQLLKFMYENSVQFPIVSKLPKKAGSSYLLGIRTFPRFREMAEQIYSWAPKWFQSIAGVHRAAHYLGFTLLLRRVRDALPKDQQWMADQMLSFLKIKGEIIQSSICLDIAMDHASTVIENYRSGILSADSRDSELNSLLISVPSRIRGPLFNKIQQLMAGDRVVNLYETRRGVGGREG